MENIGIRQWVLAVVWRLGSFLGSLILTFLGLTAVTFVIGRFMAVDPVFAMVGDRATREVYDKARIAMGLDQALLHRDKRRDIRQQRLTKLPIAVLRKRGDRSD